MSDPANVNYISISGISFKKWGSANFSSREVMSMAKRIRRRCSAFRNQIEIVKMNYRRKSFERKQIQKLHGPASDAVGARGGGGAGNLPGGCL